MLSLPLSACGVWIAVNVINTWVSLNQSHHHPAYVCSAPHVPWLSITKCHSSNIAEMLSSFVQQWNRSGGTSSDQTHVSATCRKVDLVAVQRV